MNKRLTEKDILFLLKYINLKTYKGVAKTENISPQRVGQVIRHSMRKIRSALNIHSFSKANPSLDDIETIIQSINGNRENNIIPLEKWIDSGIQDKLNSIYWRKTSRSEKPTQEDVISFIQKNYYEKIYHFW